MPRIVCISDTHNLHDRIDVPDGDVLIHAGDFTMGGRVAEVNRFAAWFAGLPHPHKVLVAGNHDWLFERSPAAARALVAEVAYLQDAGAEVAGLRIWGSPWQPWFHDWAFNLARGEAIRAKWDLIPGDVDILVTHGPPMGILDGIPTAFGDDGDPAPMHVGCADLLEAVQRVRPRMHLFGHIHEGYGEVDHGGTRFVNASNCDADYQPANPPVVVDL